MISVGSVGVRIILPVTENGVALPLSGYPTKEIIFEKPDKTQVTKTATILNAPGDDGKMYYANEADFFGGQTGKWRARAHLKLDPEHDYTSGWTNFYAGE